MYIITAFFNFCCYFLTPVVTLVTVTVTVITLSPTFSKSQLLPHWFSLLFPNCTSDLLVIANVHTVCVCRVFADCRSVWIFYELCLSFSGKRRSDSATAAPQTHTHTTSIVSCDISYFPFLLPFHGSLGNGLLFILYSARIFIFDAEKFYTSMQI